MNADHTFVICAYRESPYLQSCIDSLKQQTLRGNIMLCTSTPNEYINQLAQKNSIDLRICPERKGIAVDWNFALHEAKSSYVTLAHQDDLYHPTFTEKMINALRSRTDSLIAYSNYDEILQDHDHEKIRELTLNFLVKQIINQLNFKHLIYLQQNKQRLLKWGSPIGCPTVTYNKNNLHQFCFSDKFSINIDWAAWSELAQYPGSFIWINEVLISHRIHNQSETTLGIKENRRQIEDEIMFKQYWPPIVASVLSKLYELSYSNNG